MENKEREITVFSIVTYEAPEYFDRCLRNLDWTKKYPHIQVVVFDNSSSTDIKTIFDKYQEGYTYYHSDENLGYGKSHNEVWKFAKYEFLAKRALILMS